MKKLICCFFITASSYCFAQDNTVKFLKAETEKFFAKESLDTSSKNWRKGGQFNFNVNQGTLSNWSAGGDKFSFSLNAFLNTYAFYKKGKHSWDNNLDLAYGIINTTSLGNRKASDRIDLTSKYGFSFTKNMSLALLSNSRTQFAKGYAYLKNSNGGDSASVTSKAFAPAYVLLSLGVDYKPVQSLSIFLSPLTQRYVIVTDKRLGKFYGLDSGSRFKNEAGAFFSANFFKKLNANITVKSKLDLFSNYKNNPQNIDVFFSNVFTAKVSKFINVSVNLDIIYDDDTQNVNPEKGPAPQILQLMGIGFAYKFKG